MEKYLFVATVLKPQGIRGELKVKTFTDSPEDLCGFPRVFIDGTEYKVFKVRPAGDCAFLTLKGIADRNAAELLRDKQIFALKEDAPPLPEGRFYLVDVIGCELYTDKGKRIGEITDITPAKTDVYTVMSESGEIVFAAADGVILDIDTENKKVVVNSKRFEEVALY